jgi:hypothetical protein
MYLKYKKKNVQFRPAVRLVLMVVVHGAPDGLNRIPSTKEQTRNEVTKQGETAEVFPTFIVLCREEPCNKYVLTDTVRIMCGPSGLCRPNILIFM